ncbi:MAG: hypothetical protein ACOY71_00925 [Gemmatimonadota bacterium]
MTLLTLADASDLERWADRRDAQQMFPLLVRRLIDATARGIRQLHVRAGEGVQLEGWDGIVEVDEGNAHVPAGTSAWELGVGKDLRTKANQDYAKRSAEPGPVDPSRTTFVFATPRRWKAKEAWAAEKRSEAVWLDVRALDADDFEAWLQSAPAVHVWLSILLGKHPQGVLDLATFWNDWAAATQPALSPGLILAGRDEVAKQVMAFTARRRDEVAKQVMAFTARREGVQAVRCDSREEAVAFLAAAVVKLPLEDRDALMSRSVIVTEDGAWQQLLDSESPLLLVPLFDTPNVAAAVRRGHSVLVPLGAGDPEGTGEILVPRLPRQAARDALVQMGVDEDRAWEMAGLARRSLTALRRHLAAVPVVRTPPWAMPEHVRDVLPVLLTGQWDTQREGDRDVLAALAQEPHEKFLERMTRWINTEDPPVRRSGSVWFAASRHDLWRLAARHLTPADMLRFKQVVLRVLGSVDPQFDLEEDRRWMAGVLGHTSPYSGVLREGLADTLAIMGAHGDKILPSSGLSASDSAAVCVRELLEQANRDWRVWASLSHVLPRLAEAAPDQFLTAVEAGSRDDTPVLRHLFTDQTDAFFSSSPHTGLLWALETLAWNPMHLPRAALALARLAAIDPGGKLSNRPAKSLREIFLGWHPQTCATLEQRLDVIDLVRQREPDVGWYLLCALLPEHHGVAINTSTPRWREWLPEAKPVPTLGEYGSVVRALVDRLLVDVGRDGKRWRQLVAALEVVTPESHEAIVAKLGELEPTNLEPSAREAIWSALRELVARHRAYPNADWSLSSERVDRLDQLRARLTPDDPVAQYTWLFADSLGLPARSFGDDWRARQEAIAQERISGVKAVYESLGLARIRRLAREAKQPFFVGLAASDIPLTEREVLFLLGEDVGSDDVALAQLGNGFVAGRFRIAGWDWARDVLRQHGMAWPPERRAAFIGALPHDERAWDLASQCGAETEALFWRHKSPFGLEDHSTCIRAAEKYLEHGWVLSAVDVLASYRKDVPGGVPAELVFRVLEGAIQALAQGQQMNQMFGYHVAELTQELQKAEDLDEVRLARLEWAYLPLLNRHDRHPTILHRELKRSPAFFSEILSLIYRAEGEDPRQLTAEERARWRVAYELLDSWKSVPGSADGPELDAAVLGEWVDEARRLTAACGRGAIGDQEIGKLLSRAPAGPGGEWPHPAVCELIETVASDDMEQGFEIGVYNSRGVMWKDPTAGGQQERALADHYQEMATAISTKSPRTAAMLRRIADTYRREAAREDTEADLRENLWG